MCPEELIKAISSTNMESIIAYSFVAAKHNSISEQILKQILLHMYDDLNTKAYLKEILTVTTIHRISNFYFTRFVLAVFF
ncbi:unnamed protein product [Rotaria sp. Silwood1]|nr:unnamed protein product [Rotaria sp. Silwood1]